MKPPSIYIVFQRATFRSGLENQHFRILADLAANPINTVLLGHAHFWKNVPKSWKSIENEPILKFPGWDSGVLNPRTIIRLIRPLPSPKSGLKNQKSSKIQNIQNPKVYTKFVRQPYVSRPRIDGNVDSKHNHTAWSFIMSRFGQDWKPTCS